ncbi:hypothetical protein ABW21_db0202992 [Orbilia brochopaga]|nr:hypothetical protein ABW21_db0202992 [Drechslerella brochopaga]
MAAAKLLELPYELQFQILTELLEPVVSFVFHSPVQTLEWREDMEQYGFKDLGIEESKTLPCTVAISMPPAGDIIPPPCLLVSHSFTTTITAIAQDHCERLERRLSRCLVGGTPYCYISKEPQAITPEFLHYVATGRLVFAGHSVNMLKTVRDEIPLPVREAVTSVFCSRLATMQMWTGTPVANMKVWRRSNKPDYDRSLGYLLKTMFPELRKLGFAMAKKGTKEEFWCPEAISAMTHILLSGPARELEVAYGEDDVNDDGEKRAETSGVGYACTDWRLFAGTGGGRFVRMIEEPYWHFGNMSLSYTATRVSKRDLRRRGRYTDPSSAQANEEDVVWRVTRPESKTDEMLQNGRTFEWKAITLCQCHTCEKRRASDTQDEPRVDGKGRYRYVKRLMRLGRNPKS